MWRPKMRRAAALWYAMCGNEAGCAATICNAICDTETRYAATRSTRRSTSQTRQTPLCSYAPAMRCPVLTDILYGGVGHGRTVRCGVRFWPRAVADDKEILNNAKVSARARARVEVRGERRERGGREGRRERERGAGAGEGEGERVHCTCGVS
eukprot:482650-Rhodomonas_salina.2